jgi:hypothetical protein
MSMLDDDERLKPYRIPDGLPDYGTPLADMFRRRTAELYDRVLADTEQSIRQWADAVGITPETWLEWYYVELEIKHGDGLGLAHQLRYTLTPRVRGRQDVDLLHVVFPPK